MERLHRIFACAGGSLGPPPADAPALDSSEQVYISSLALIKMLKHGRAGVPMEVMGLMLGEFVDEYTVRMVDVFDMPQSGTGVSVEAVDHVFQTNMLDMLKQTGRPEMVVGWYHSRPGFGCWLSGVDINTQQVWDKKMVHPEFNWCWHHVPTFAPYKVEGTFFPLILAHGGTTQTVKTATIVLQSLTPNAHSVFKVLAEHQLAHLMKKVFLSIICTQPVESD